jgi:hypothetical protein
MPRPPAIAAPNSATTQTRNVRDPSTQAHAPLNARLASTAIRISRQVVAGSSRPYSAKLAVDSVIGSLANFE